MSTQLEQNLNLILNEKETKILPENIKKDVQIFDIVGTLENSGIDTSDATATASDIISPKTAYGNGKKITGNIIPEYKIDDVSEYKTKLIKSLSGVDVFHIYEYNNYVSIITMSGTTINFIIYDNTQNTIIGSTTFSSLDTFDAGISGSLNFIVGDIVNYVYSDTENETKYIIGVTGESKSEYYRQAFLMLKYNKLDNTFSFSTTTAKRVYFGHNGTVPNTQRFALDPRVPNVLYLYESSWSGGSFGKITLSIDESDVVTPTLSTDITRYISTVGSFSFTGNGDYISTGSHLIKRNANTGDITKYTQGYTYLSYNLNYMWIANKLYKITPNDDFNTMFNSKELIFDCGLTGNYVAYFSQDEKYIIVDTTSANLGIATYKITNDTVTLSKSFNYNSYLLESGLNSLNFYTWNNEDKTLMRMFAEAGESRLSKLNKDDLCFINIEEYNVPDNSKVLSGATYYRSDGTITSGSMPNNGELNYTPSDNELIIPAGYTSGGIINAMDITTLEDYKTCEAIADNILGDTKPYIELQYVKGTGTQYINTGYTPNANTKVEVKANVVVTPTKYWEVLFGSRPSYQNSDFSFATSYQNGAKMVLGYGTNAELSGTYPASGKDAIIKLDKGKLTISVDGKDIYTYTKTGTFTNAIPMYLMSWVSESSTYSREGTAQANTKLYYCKIWENDELVRNYIPVKDNSGVGALYDLVQNKLYYSESDDDFVAGGVI